MLDELVSDILLWIPSHGRAKVDDHLEPIYNSSVPIQDVTLKIYQERWTKSGETGSGKSVLAARHDVVEALIIRMFTMTGHPKERK